MEKSYFYVWLTLEYLGLKLIIHCHVQLYSPTFRNRKSRALKSVNKRFSRLKRRRESELHLRLAKFRLFWAKTDYILQSATLYLRFSESKRRAKDFRGSDAAAKAWLRGGFRLPKHTTPPKFQKTLVSHCPRNCVAKSPRDRRADGAGF